MTALLAIAGLTCRAVFRLRTGWLLLLLIAALLAIPLGPGGAEVRILGVLGPGQSLLVIAALWLAADLASREFDEQTILTLAVRPVAPTIVLLGRWLGLLACELPLLALLGLGLASQLSAGPAGWRWAAIEAPDFVAEAESRLRTSDQYQATTDPIARESLRRKAIGECRAAWQTIGPGESRTWRIPVAADAGALTLVLLPRGGDEGVLAGALALGPPGRLGAAMTLKLPSERATELDLAGLPVLPGELELHYLNQSSAAIVFSAEDGVRVRWREISFGGNLARVLAIVAGQLALMTALGLLLGSSLSFPVAAFCGLAYLVAAGLVGLVAGRLHGDVILLGRQGLEQPLLEKISQVGLQIGWWLTAALTAGRPVASLAEGVAVPLPLALSIGLGAGLGGSLVLLGIGGLVLRRREMGGLAA